MAITSAAFFSTSMDMVVCSSAAVAELVIGIYSDIISGILSGILSSLWHVFGSTRAQLSCIQGSPYGVRV